MPRVTGFLRVMPGGDLGLGPDHELPEDATPGHDLPSGGHPWIPGHLPSPPPHVWPPLTPSHPIQPAPPGTPPGTIWPPVNPVAPPPSGETPPPTVDAGLPPAPYWVIVGIPGVGWKYVVIDPSLVAGTPLPPTATPKT